MNISPDNAVRFAWAAWLVTWLVAAAWSSRIERRLSPREEGVYRLLMMLGALLLFGIPRWRSLDVVLWRPGWNAACALVCVAMCGFIFTWWARIVLGRMWSSGVTRKVDHAIITAGPYRMVRHPIYSGIILAVLATAAIGATARSAAGALLIILGLFIKARMEEGFLRSELGEEAYGAYARRVPMLVPFAGGSRS